MERIQALIDKLHQQKNEQASPSQLILTVEMIRSELQRYQQKNGVLGTAKVAVTLPVNMNFSEEVIRSAVAPVEEVLPSVEETIVPLQEEVLISKQEARPYAIRKPETETFKTQETSFNPAFRLTEEQTVSANSMKELHEIIAEKKESLNDRLKQEQKELAHALKESPIKDLRKGVGINDRFTFINELFKGDEAMYERSIKTINAFNIYSEAEYWINRELKLKLGWNEDNEGVQHFYHLVRRRFS